MKKKYFVLHPAKFRLDGGAMFGIIPKPLWERVAPPDELNRIDMALRCMLIQTHNQNILIDTGIGDYHGTKWDERFDVRGQKQPLLEILKNDFNLLPDDITDVIVSHLHFDHVGGLGEAQSQHVALFPKATLHLHKDHYEYACNSSERDAGSFQKEYFLPLIESYQKKNQINWLTFLEGEITAGLKYKVSHGHTPFLLHAYDEKFIYMADLVPTSHHVRIPWVMGYDISPGVTVQDKRRIYQFILENNLTLIFEHDPTYWGSKIIAEKNDFKAIEQGSSENKKFLEIFS
jgi:glyoxylase-like metal-dependent hydrolase (beta-lactamase superfamily II)